MSADLTAADLAAADQERAYALSQWRRVVAVAGRLLADGHDATASCMALCRLVCRDLDISPDPEAPEAMAVAMLAAAAVAEAARTTPDDLDGGTP